MFNECSSLKKLNMQNFILNNPDDMSCMFSGCNSLDEIKTSNSVLIREEDSS